MPQLPQTWFLDLSRLRCNQPHFRRLDLAQYEGMILINDKLYVIMMMNVVDGDWFHMKRTS